MALLDGLNPRQREAVTAIDGPVLVIAGAGTGKTRVITYRVAYLIEQGVPGRNILAVTFTNKAAEQMRRRIGDLVLSSGRDASDIWISTFHSFCARLLRREAPAAGLSRSFAIYDDDDQTRTVKLALQNLKLPEKELPPRALRDRISHAKNHAISPQEMEAEASDPFTKKTAAVYREYESILRKSAAVDFDDLLLRAVALLRDNSQVRARWSEQFRFIHVDEFQDTNASQEELVRLLAGKERNVCVVGDEDQSIYSWRGAVSGNFQRFLNDFPGARTIRLEENYRSTQVILDAAAGVVSHNRSRLGKELKAVLGAGDLLKYYEARDASDEAEYIGGQISALIRENSDSTLAVLYRTSAQSRPFEETLRRVGIRYRVVGGFSFYQRAEVKDALAYIRLLFHPDDDVALLRVLNVPPRGIGKVTIDSLRAVTRESNESLWQAIPRLASQKIRGASALTDFRQMVLDFTAECAAKSPAETLEIILSRTGYLDWAEQQDRLDQSSRADNLRELSTAIAEAIEQGETLEDVLDRASLVADTDEFDQSIPVSLMTLHSAKGLEFDHVFLAGLEEGLLPHGRSMNSDNDIEEERRLCYVGMTRAKCTLSLSRAVYRRSWANQDLSAATPSRFLAEVPGDLVEAAHGSLAEPGETRRYEPDPDYYQSQYRPARKPAAARATAVAAGSSGTSNRLIGQRVRHPSFGIGTILKIEDDGDDRRLTVSFRDYGTKKFIERYAHLEIV